MLDRIAIATGNAGMAAEYAAVLDIDVTPAKAELTAVQSLDVVDVAARKAADTHAPVGQPVLVDDTGLRAIRWSCAGRMGWRRMVLAIAAGRWCCVCRSRGIPSRGRSLRPGRLSRGDGLTVAVELLDGRAGAVEPGLSSVGVGLLEEPGVIGLGHRGAAGRRRGPRWRDGFSTNQDISADLRAQGAARHRTYRPWPGSKKVALLEPARMDLRCARAPFSRRASAAVPARCLAAHGTITATVRIRAYSRAPLRKPGHAVDITTRIERRQVLGGSSAGTAGRPSDAKILVRD